MAVCILALVAAAVAVAAWPGRHHGSGAAAAPAPTVRAVHDALAARLRTSQLTYHWIVCTHNGRRYHGQLIVRCNVNFGDPHIEAYCSVLEDGRLLTDHEQPAIPCDSDLAGASVSIVHS